MAILDLTAVRDWFNANFKLATADTVASVLTLTFDATLIGQTWTVTDGDEETYTGTVDASLTAEVKLRQLLTSYTVTCGVVTGNVEVGYFYEPFALSMIPYSIANTLPASTAANVITFATIQNFDASNLTWGTGGTPVTVEQAVAKNAAGDAVRLDSYTKNAALSAHVTFDGTTQDATVYMVCAIVGGNYSASDSYMNIFCKANGSDSTREMIYGSGTGNGGRFEVRGSGSSATTAAGAYPFGGKYVVLVLRYSATNSAAKGWLNLTTLSSATAPVTGTTLYFGQEMRTSMSGAQKVNRSCDLDVKLIAVVNEAEADETIGENVNNLMEVFGL